MTDGITVAELQTMRGQNILVVEDEIFVAQDIVAELESIGAVPIGPVARIVDALELIETGVVDGAILDVRLIDGDIEPVARRLAQDGVPFVIATGSGLPERMRAEFAAVPVISKPTLPSNLFHVLGAQLAA